MMGIYPDEKFERNTITGIVTRIYNGHDGLISTTIYEPILRIESRSNCYCCSCFYHDEYTRNDPYCRNHGFIGKRKCEFHEMPGDSWERDFDTEEDTDKVLLTVQQERTRNG